MAEQEQPTPQGAIVKIDGVEHQLVSGTHLSMIRNVTAQNSRVPPAVPLIVEFLGEE